MNCIAAHKCPGEHKGQMILVIWIKERSSGPPGGRRDEGDDFVTVLSVGSRGKFPPPPRS